METDVPGIHAVGDAVGNPMLAHKAVHEGENGGRIRIRPEERLYSHEHPFGGVYGPGNCLGRLYRKTAISEGVSYEKGSFPWGASGRALSADKDYGTTKALFDTGSGRIIGAGIVGARAGDLIAEAALAIENGRRRGGHRRHGPRTSYFRRNTGIRRGIGRGNHHRRSAVKKIGNYREDSDTMNDMKKRILGKTGFGISEISLGTWQVGGKWGSGFDDTLAESILEDAIDSGVNFIDTADVYENRRSEAAVGRVVRRRSERIYVATKCGRFIDPHVNEGYTPEALRGYVERSLKNTGFEALDLIQLHCPPTAVFYRPEIFELFDRLKEEGKILNLGVSVEKVKKP